MKRSIRSHLSRSRLDKNVEHPAQSSTWPRQENKCAAEEAAVPAATENTSVSVDVQHPDSKATTTTCTKKADEMSAKPAGNLKRMNPPLVDSTKKQGIDSEFIRKVDNIPVVHNTLEYILSKYGVIKDVNPLVKTSLERSEGIAFWLRQRASDVITATKLDRPLKKLDSAAANGVTRVERTGSDIRHRIEETNKDVQAKIKKMKDRTNAVGSSFFGGIQTFIDNLEARCEPVMLKPSPDAEKLSTEPTLSMTSRRSMDLTYRLYAGILHYSATRAKAVVNPEAWAAVYKRHFSPTQIQLRVAIICQAVLASPSNRLQHMEDKDLTELDRRLISLSHYLFETSQAAVDSAKAAPGKLTATVYSNAPGKLTAMVWSPFSYVGGVFRHIRGAKFE